MSFNPKYDARPGCVTDKDYERLIREQLECQNCMCHTCKLACKKCDNCKGAVTNCGDFTEV